MRRQAHGWSTVLDDEITARTGLDEVALRRLRRAVLQRYRTLTFGELVQLEEGGAPFRFAFLHWMMQALIPPEQWARWVAYLGRTERELDGMATGEHLLSEYIIKVYSAVYGIGLDFLLVATPPRPNPDGVVISVWTMASV